MAWQFSMDETEQKFFIAGLVISIIVGFFLKKIRVPEKSRHTKKATKKSFYTTSITTPGAGQSGGARRFNTYSGKASWHTQGNTGSNYGRSGTGHNTSPSLQRQNSNPSFLFRESPIQESPPVPSYGEMKPFKVYNKTVPYPHKGPFGSAHIDMMKHSASAQMMSQFNNELVSPSAQESPNSFSHRYTAAEDTWSGGIHFRKPVSPKAPSAATMPTASASEENFNYKAWSEQRLMSEIGLQGGKL